MKEFKTREIDFNIIKLNRSIEKMVEVMKSEYEDIEVKDMSD